MKITNQNDFILISFRYFFLHQDVPFECVQISIVFDPRIVIVDGDVCFPFTFTIMYSADIKNADRHETNFHLKKVWLSSLLQGSFGML